VVAPSALSTAVRKSVRHRVLPAARCQRHDVLLLEETCPWGRAERPRAGSCRVPWRHL